jgi:hypothetical protein
LEAAGVLIGEGRMVQAAVDWTVIHDLPRAPLGALQAGLRALAMHFGLQPRKIMLSRNAASETARVPAP